MESEGPTDRELQRLGGIPTEDNQQDAVVNVTLRVGGLMQGSVQTAG